MELRSSEVREKQRSLETVQRVTQHELNDAANRKKSLKAKAERLQSDKSNFEGKLQEVNKKIRLVIMIVTGRSGIMVEHPPAV